MSSTAAVNESGAGHQKGKGRDARGRFAEGNAGGPGNPFARKVAMLRTALVNFVTEDDMKHIAFILKEKAMGGDLAAIKLLFQYVLGKPTEAVDPDRLDVDEWEKVQERALPPEEAAAVLERLPADMACGMTRIAWPGAVEQNLRAAFGDELQAMGERDARRGAAGSGDPRQAQGERDARRGAAGSGDPRRAMGERDARRGAAGSGDPRRAQGARRGAAGSGDPRRAQGARQGASAKQQARGAEGKTAGVKPAARPESAPIGNGDNGPMDDRPRPSANGGTAAEAGLAGKKRPRRGRRRPKRGQDGPSSSRKSAGTPGKPGG